MSRHRNVRSINYSDEYDGYDDVYGHSVEDDYCISPSDAAQFLYDREGSRGQQKISSFMKTDEDIAEEDETAHEKTETDDYDQARLNSCIDSIKSTIDINIPHNELVNIILRNNYNIEGSIDQILNLKEKKLPDNNVLEKKIDKPTVKIIASDSKSTNVKKGFDIQQKDLFRNLTPRSQSPASRSDSPIEKVLELSEEIKEGKKKNIAAEYNKMKENKKDHLYMVVIGHVDAGKSTLMGHLLCDLGQVNQRTIHKYEQESRKLGKQSFVYAWVLDETGEERTRGITMDIGVSQFETKTKSITLLDAPGHKDFIPNMISGAGQADVALLVVDATRGEFETGFDLGGQTREHALLVRSLGVNQLAVVVNKMDTVNWSEERFSEISQKLGLFLKQAGFRESDVTYVPCSGMTGQNLIQKPTENDLLKWYSGPCLIDVIDNFRAPERLVTKPFRLSINDIFKGTGSAFCVSGRIETGCLSVGDRILICPTREQATVKGISLDELPTQTVYAGDQASVTLSGVEMQNVAVGYILCDPSRPVPITSKFEARIVVFNVTIPITKGFSIVLHHQSLAEPAVISKLIAQLHKNTGEIVKKRPRCLGNNSSASVEISTTRPIAVELYCDCKELGRIMLRSGGVTVAAGLITRIIY